MPLHGPSALVNIVVGGSVGPTSFNPSDVVYESDEFNFVLTDPGYQWLTAGGLTRSPNTRVAFARQSPEIYFMVMADTPGVNSGVDEYALVENVKTMMKSSIQSKVLEDRQHGINGRRGRYMFVETATNRERQYVAFWMMEHNGFAFQLMVQSSAPKTSVKPSAY